jgi:hypothetical protein
MRELRPMGVAAVLALAAAGCVIVPKDLPDERFTAALVDSLRWSNESSEKTLWRVEVRSDTAVDTIPDLLTDRAIVAVPKVGVEGFAFDTARGAIHQGFRYDPKKRTVKPIVLAEDLAGPFAAPALSPDGRHVAYLSVADGKARAVVRVFPRGRIVASGPALAVPPGDVAPGEASWTSADSFTVLVDALPFRRVRFQGTVASGITAADTVTVAPRP